MTLPQTVIPAKVVGKFSIRLVPPQTPDIVAPLTVKYIQDEFAKLGSKNKLDVQLINSGKPWVADINHWNYEAARKATRAVYHKEPNMTREGGSIPVTLTFAEALNTNVVLLPMGREFSFYIVRGILIHPFSRILGGDDGAQCVPRHHFINFIAFLTHLFQLHERKTRSFQLH